MICDTCGLNKTGTRVRVFLVGKRVFAWRICKPCVLRERELGDGGAAAAIEQAERAGA